MIPVVLIHRGYEEYLKCALLQAKKSNFTYLIGDTKPPIEGDDSYEFVDIKNYQEDCDKFRGVYEHLNTTPKEYEIFCFQRWFILRNFMKERNLEKVFYIDSDVLLFCNVNDEWDKYSQYEMTLLHRTAAISSFMTFKGVDNFCNLIMNTYSNKASYSYKKISSHYESRKSCGLGGGVCDMTLFDFFHYSSADGGGPNIVGEMMQIIDDTTYDHNINVPNNGYAFNGKHKNFKIRNGVPYVFNSRLNKDIKFNSLHFQGPGKKLIPGVFQQCEEHQTI